MSLNCIKIGIRQNLLYPFLFMIYINILRIIRVAFLEITRKDYINSIFAALTFPSNIFLGGIFLYLENKENKAKREQLFENHSIQERDSKEKSLRRLYFTSKIILLIFLDAYLEFIGLLRQIYYLELKPPKTNIITLDIRIRSREIIVASIICYLTIGTQLKRHHIVSLIIILICILSFYIFETIVQFNLEYFSSVYKFLKLQVLKVIINICRVLSDVIEKYLFEFIYFSPFKLLFLKGIMQTIFMAVFYLFNINYAKKEFSNLFDKHNTLYIVFSVIALLLYFFVSGYSSIYKLYTVKMYSPMTRTLSDTVMDVFYFIYISKNEKETYNIIFIPHFWATLIEIIIMLFFNLVYNEFLVLNFGGMEKDTHLEIEKRASEIELIDNDDNTSCKSGN